VVKDADSVRQPRDRSFTLVFFLLAVTLSCSIVVLLAPRPVQPSQLPSLRLDRAAVDAQRTRERQLVLRARSFERDADVQQLLALVRAEGLAELEPFPDREALRARRVELASLAQRVFVRLGAEGTRAWFASVTELAITALHAPASASAPPAPTPPPVGTVEPALPTSAPTGDARSASAMSTRSTDEASRGLLGDFPTLLARYGYADADGRVWAPALAIRTLYKARLNLICERPLDTDLTPIELQAYEGYNALHAGPMPPQRRAKAALAFQRAGGHHGTEAAAIWLYQGGGQERAVAMLREEYERTGLLRLKNLVLGAQRVE